MKRIIVGTILWLVLTGCIQSAEVLSSDGAQRLGACDGSEWMDCAKKYCPNGYDVVYDHGSCNPGSLIKCKP